MQQTKELEVSPGQMIEVWGIPIDIAYQSKPSRNLTLLIKDEKSGKIVSAMTTRTKRLRQFFRQYGYHYKEIDKLEGSKLESRLEDLLEDKQKMLFRIEGIRGSANRIFAIATERWKKVTIEALIPDIKRAFKETSSGMKLMYDVSPSTEKHGGQVMVWYPESAILRPYVVISAGLLDAWNSIRMYGGCKILGCSNMLSAEVREELQPILGSSFSIRQVHAGENLYEDMKGMISTAIGEMSKFQEYIKKAKKIDIKEKQLLKIFTYYQGHNMLSRKVIEASMKQYEVEEDSGTLWGLCMALTYVGSNTEVKKTPQRRLTSIGGELLVVSPVFDKYTSIVEDYIKKNKLETIDLSKAEVVASA